MKAKITESTDGKYIGETISTDLLSVSLPSGEIIEIIGRAHLGNGAWKLWNSNYILTVKAESI